jgi:hypothetical protein
MTKEHCNHCKRRVYACCDFLHENGTWSRIPVCKKHFGLGLAEQNSIAIKERFEMQARFWREKTARDIAFFTSLAPLTP